VGHQISIVFFFEGKEYYGKMRILGFGRYEKQEALRFEMPDALYINDNFGLTEFHLMPRKDITFTSMFNQFCTGSLVNIGPSGVDFKSKESMPVKELIAVDKETDLGFELSSDLRIVTRGRVLYITKMGGNLVGVRFDDDDPAREKAISEWIHVQSHAKQNADAAFLRERMMGKRTSGPVPEREDANAFRIDRDYKTLMHEGDPKVLVLSRDENTIQRIAKALKRKYGVLVSKGRYKNVLQISTHFRPQLILISDTLDTISGFDLCQTLNEQNNEPPPMVVVGETGDEFENRNKAASAGALDYWNIDPFHPLSFFKKVQETLAMFAIEEN